MENNERMRRLTKQPNPKVGEIMRGLRDRMEMVERMLDRLPESERVLTLETGEDADKQTLVVKGKEELADLAMGLEIDPVAESDIIETIKEAALRYGSEHGFKTIDDYRQLLL